MGKTTPVKRRIEFISWRDAVSVDEWHDSAEVVPMSHLIESCGIWIGESDDVVVLALNVDTENGALSCVMHIPKGMIVKRRRVSIEL